MADNEEKLVKMLKYVSEHNDFYKKRIKEYGISNPLDITQWPVLTRKELQENRYNMFSDGYKRMFYAQKLLRKYTSGSSGIPITIYWDLNDYYKSMSTLWRKRYAHYGVKANDRVVKFELLAFECQNDNNKVFHIIENRNTLQINKSCLLSEENYLSAIKIINDFNPKWIYIQPFLLSHFLYCFQKFNLKIPNNLRYIESYGEYLSPKLKNAVIDYFRIPVANMYGSEEFNAIAYECLNGHMHVFSDNVYIAKDEKYSSSSIITGLCNHAMPIINYDLGDIINIGNLEKNLCSDGCMIIENICGRTRSGIRISNVEINDYFFSEVMDDVNNQFADIILCYKLIYHEQSKKLEVNICVPSEKQKWFPSVSKCIKRVLTKKLPMLNDTAIFVYNQNFDETAHQKFLLVNKFND